MLIFLSVPSAYDRCCSANEKQPLTSQPRSCGFDFHRIIYAPSSSWLSLRVETDSMRLFKATRGPLLQYYGHSDWRRGRVRDRWCFSLFLEPIALVRVCRALCHVSAYSVYTCLSRRLWVSEMNMIRWWYYEICIRECCNATQQCLLFHEQKSNVVRAQHEDI
jgi:hypothetical protein